MAWYRNHYHCGDCGTDWDDEWSCCCDDECPECGSRHWSPLESEDLTEEVARGVAGFIVMRSPSGAGDKPRYRVSGLYVARFGFTASAPRRLILSAS
jgi:hypothetical protein